MAPLIVGRGVHFTEYPSSSILILSHAKQWTLVWFMAEVEWFVCKIL